HADPTSSALSNTVTLSPAARSVTAQASPAGPAPTMIAFGPDVMRIARRLFPLLPRTLSGGLPAPDLLGQFDREPEFCPLLVLGEDVAFLGGGETALRRQRK